jgi:hypothetical protein
MCGIMRALAQALVGVYSRRRLSDCAWAALGLEVEAKPAG